MPFFRATDTPGGPSMLDLVRLSPAPVFPPGGEDLYRQIARLVELEPGREVLDAACGRGVSTLFLSSTYGVDASGVDPDESLIREADARSREQGTEGRVNFQAGSLDDLPYRDAGRLVIRESGTEPVIRVMAESDDEGLVEAVVTDIASAIQRVA